MAVMRKFSIIVLALIAAVLLIKAPADAQERLRIAWAGDSPANTPIWVVESKGLL